LSDIFREVDEEMRRDQLRKLWERYGIFFIALAILFVAAVGGWRAYGWWQAKLAAQAGSAFTEALVLGEQGKHQEAEAAFAKIAAEGTASYRSLAALRAAGELAERDPKAAIGAYESLANNKSLGPLMQEMAVLRAAFLMVDTAPYEQLRARIEPLTTPERTYRHSARNCSYVVNARRWLEMILADGDTPGTTRSQAEMLMTMIGGAGNS
jgi:hypothetical protein